MRDQVVIVTGASSGIGKASASGIAALGAHVVLVSRTESRGRRALDDIARAVPAASLDLLVADLSTIDAITALAHEFKRKYSRLDVLFNNAGLITNRRRVTPDGLELQFMVNYLAYYLLTGMLLDTLHASRPARIINMTSSSHSSGVINFDDLQLERHYRGWQAYANTKLMSMVYTYELARRLEGSGITANCLHPGVIRTGLMRNFSSVLHVAWTALGRFFKQPDDGAATPVYLASSPEVEGVTGTYFRYCRPFGTTEASHDPDVQRRLWEASERLSGYRYQFPA
ncbi:MAG TPA: SDR family oxidoreductase [Candidatus Krumholzibacteria bacterium]|nr:SDR family oxidoreductase [Candidatus Krumholzibacteria bacterium]